MSNQVNDYSSLKAYRTRIPNVLFELDLDPYAISLYIYYKRIAGDYGKCCKNKSSISKKLNMSATVIKNRNKVLSQGFDYLDGKSLIKITQSKSMTTTVEICDIWSENFQKLSESEGEVSNV